ncbi:hypothetical protein [Actinopolyspora mzabensis]|uniref:hypothetical protein n=1 Tax=Actinopolyspora mzabensis TaxID=995066 RepID=UPI00115FDB95|nr:hypothetical protein [Actinopolyspora mzabensis]
MQIAHIRSAKSGGPRHDPSYDRAKLNSDENLLLLCNGPHHDHVDKHEDLYTISELLEWKSRQIAQGGGCSVTDIEIDPLVRKLDEFIASLKEVNFVVELRGGVGSNGSGLIATALEAPVKSEEVNSDGAKYIGIRAENHGLLPIGVEVAGLEFDVGQVAYVPYHLSNRFTRYPVPCSLGQRESGEWFAHQDEIRDVMIALCRKIRCIPTRFRAFVRIGTGVAEFSSWASIAILPIWNSDITEDDLQVIFAS